MKVSTFRLAWLLTLVAAAGTSLGTNGTSRDPELQQIAGYRQWQRLTDQPFLVNTASFSG